MADTFEGAQQHKSSADKYKNGTVGMAEQAQETAKQATEMASEALDKIDEWLKPTGLSLKKNPGMTLAVVAGVAAIAGAVFLSRSQQTNTERITDELTKLARRAGFQ